MGTTSLKSTRITATGTVVSGRHRLRGISMLCAGTANARITIRDGGGTGTIIFDWDGPNSATWQQSIEFEDNGLLFGTDMHATLTNVSGATLVYD